MPPTPNMQEILRLTEENNKLLHKMHRHAVWGGWIKFILYAAIFIAAPLWIYSTYLAPAMEQILETYQQIQGTGAKAQAQFGDIQSYLQQFTSQFSQQE
jgi:F0F1-type ATP synthase membrane subunit b/b'